MSSRQNSKSALIADIGGTNAHFALVDGPGAKAEMTRTLTCDDYPALVDATRAYFEMIDCAVPDRAAIAIATDVSSDRMSMINHNWDFSVTETRKALGTGYLKFINDFTAFALALTYLRDEECIKVGGGKSCAGQPMAVLGPGAGLGVSGLIPAGERWIPLQGEGGHVRTAP